MIGYNDHLEEAQHTPTTFRIVLGGCKKPELETFNLTCFTVTEAEIITLLQDSYDIHHVLLYDVKMISDSWENYVFKHQRHLASDNLWIKGAPCRFLRGNTIPAY